MMKRGIFAIIAAVGVISTAGAHAQTVKSSVTASNGVTVEVSSDEFAQRYEYGSPIIKAKSTQGASMGAVVSKVRSSGSLHDLSLQGFFVYSGDWKFFDRAVFRGGDPVKITRIGGDVGSCRYGCTLSETFIIELTLAEIAKHTENGTLPIQIRSRGADTALLEVPTSYIDAVNEVAK